MRTIALIWRLMLTLCIMLPSAAMAQKKPLGIEVGRGEIRVVYLMGSVRFMPRGDGKWYALNVDEALRGGEEIKIGERSRLELALPDQSILRFADETCFKLMQAPEAGLRDIKIHMIVGRAWANISKAMGIRRKFEISCDHAVVGVRGTVYRMNVHEDKSALVRVYEGEVAVSGASRPMDKGEPVFGKKPTPISSPKPVAGPYRITMEEWTVLLRSMQQISIQSDGTSDKPRGFTEQEDRDAWVDWNKQRDAEANKQ